jgi:N-glycosylase/DNA lyase
LPSERANVGILADLGEYPRSYSESQMRPLLRAAGLTPSKSHPRMTSVARRRSFPVRDYDLAATFTSGQAFRWRRCGEGWVGVIGNRWVRLQADGFTIVAETAEPVADWAWLAEYLQLPLDLGAVFGTFPDDEPIRAAVAACRGLRLLRQDPWECLASFILSSTKQISQIQQIVSLLCERYGEPVAVPAGHAPVCAFPAAVRLARSSEAELRACKMGFRAPYLLATARTIADGQFDLGRVPRLPVEAARAELMTLPGVGRKIADCVLLFAYGCSQAFPVDVWVAKALQQLYFPRRRVRLPRLQQFATTHFGPNAGYAQQYLFHYMRKIRPRRAATL